jgi:hypothetical protein
MQQLGLAPPQANPQQLNMGGGLMSAKPLRTLLAQEATAAAIKQSAEQQNQGIIQSLATHIRADWTRAKKAKLIIEQEMLESIYARRGEYTPAKLAEIKEQGGSEIYMMLFATKARQAKALLGDVMIGSGTEKPWSIHATPKPDLPPELVDQIMQGVQQAAMQAEMGPQPLEVEQIRQMLRDAKSHAEQQINEQASTEATRAETEIEDIMVEGGFLEALDQYIDDLTVFKTACIKGPIVRRTPQLTWQRAPGQLPKAVVETRNSLHWERVDPLMLYPSPFSRSVDDGPLIERHRLSRSDLSALIGVDGYNEDAIRAVLDAHGTGGLKEWLTIDTARLTAEGRLSTAATDATGLIDALQYWGSVSGKMLLEWGMSKEEVLDEAKEYEVEAWLIGEWVIKATLNPDPLCRRPYYCDGYSRIPGAFWHNSLFDLLRDCVNMCNAAARALSNNMGISSGPQVMVNIDRLPKGEQITEMYPWKMWQTITDPAGSSAAPISFFQPQSNAAELMGIYEKFSTLADEYSGIPRYMTGNTDGAGGAGRTATGMSMMIGNASKQIRQLVSSTDIHVIGPAVQGAFDWKMNYDPLADYQGDLKIVARGALSLTVKDSAQVRRNEFLASTMNPVDMQIIGIEGRAQVLRESAKSLDLNVDKVVPSESVMRAKSQAAAQQQMQPQGGQPQGGPPQSGQPQGGQPQNGQSLMNSAPVTDNFSPTPQ